MRTTLDLPDDLFRRLKAHAALRGKTLRQLFVEFTEHELSTLPAPVTHVSSTPQRAQMGQRSADFVD